MAGADPNVEKVTPSQAENAPNVMPAAHDLPTVDLAVRSAHIDEMEDLTSSLISPNRLRPLTRDGVFNGIFHVHGFPDFGTFATGYGRPIGVSIEYEPTDERMGFILAPKGSARVTIDGREFEVSDQHGIVLTAGPSRTLNYLDDCETSVLVMNTRRIADQCAKLLADDLDRPLRFDTGFDLDNARGQSWLRLFQYATAELANPHSMFRISPTARQQLEQTAMTGFRSVTPTLTPMRCCGRNPLPRPSMSGGPRPTSKRISQSRCPWPTSPLMPA